MLGLDCLDVTGMVVQSGIGLQDIPATNVPRSGKLRSGDAQSLNRDRICDPRGEFEMVFRAFYAKTAKRSGRR